MAKVGIFMANGCEEIEGLTVVDILRRAGIEIILIALEGETVTGSHEIRFQADTVKAKVDYAQLDGIVLPGGMPGTLHLGKDEVVINTIHSFAEEGKLVAAICAAPSVLGQEGILKGKKATCYPGFEDKLTGAQYECSSVVTDGNVITSRGMGTAIEFSLAILSYFQGKEAADKMADAIIYS